MASTASSGTGSQRLHLRSGQSEALVTGCLALADAPDGHRDQGRLEHRSPNGFVPMLVGWPNPKVVCQASVKGPRFLGQTASVGNRFLRGSFVSLIRRVAPRLTGRPGVNKGLADSRGTKQGTRQVERALEASYELHSFCGLAGTWVVPCELFKGLDRRASGGGECRGRASCDDAFGVSCRPAEVELGVVRGNGLGQRLGWWVCWRYAGFGGRGG